MTMSGVVVKIMNVIIKNYGVLYKIVCYFFAVHVISSPSLSATSQTTAGFVHITSKKLQKTART